MNAEPVALGGLEDLTALSPAPRRRLTGPVVSVALLDLVCTPSDRRAARRGIVSGANGARASARPGRVNHARSTAVWERGDARQRDDLVANGWFTAQGQPTLRTLKVRRDLGATPELIELRATDAGGTHRGWIRVGATLMVVAVEAERVSLGAEAVERGLMSFEVQPVAALPIVLARWGGLAPTWNYDEVHDLGDAAGVRAVEDKVRDAQTPPPSGADEGLRDLWRRPWTRWTVRGPRLAAPVEYLSVPGAGQYVVRRRTNGGTVLAPRPGSLVWGDLQQLAATVTGQDQQDADDAADW